jgi:DNA-binding response OmpR family regulator
VRHWLFNEAVLSIILHDTHKLGLAACGKLVREKEQKMSSSRHNILYIDDDPKLIDLVTHILQRGGYQVIGAERGEDGIKAAQTHHPDLILLDLILPDMDGWAVYRHLKNNSITQNIPVIIITAKSQSIDRVLGLNVARADAYISKPFYPQELLNSVTKILAPGKETDRPIE